MKGAKKKRIFADQSKVALNQSLKTSIYDFFGEVGKFINGSKCTGKNRANPVFHH